MKGKHLPWMSLYLAQLKLTDLLASTVFVLHCPQSIRRCVVRSCLPTSLSPPCRCWSGIWQLPAGALPCSLVPQLWGESCSLQEGELPAPCTPPAQVAARPQIRENTGRRRRARQWGCHGYIPLGGQGGPSWAGSGQEWAGIVVCTYSDSSSSEWLRLVGLLRNILSLKSLVYI